MVTLHAYGIDHAGAPLEVRDPERNGLIPPEGACEGISHNNPLEPLARAMDNRCLRDCHQAGKAAAHLFAEASALHSGMPGDTQIASQVATAARTARLAATLGPVPEHPAAAELHCARRSRRETGLAVLQSIRRLVPPASRHARPVRVLLLGAGVIAEEVAIHLLTSGSAYREIAIAGVWARDKHKAVRFAAKFGMPCFSAQVAARSLHDVDAVIGACRGRVGLLSERVLSPVLASRADPLLVVDLGVPRNLDSGLVERDGISAIFLDQLHRQMRDRTRIIQEASAALHRTLEQAFGSDSINRSDPLGHDR